MTSTSKHYSLRLDAESQAIVARGHERRARRGQQRISDSAMIQALLRLGERYQCERGHGRSLEAMLRGSAPDPMPMEPPAPSVRPPAAPVASPAPLSPDEVKAALATLEPEVTKLRRAQRFDVRFATERLCKLAPELAEEAAWEWLQNGLAPKAAGQAVFLHAAASRYVGELRSMGDYPGDL